MTFVDNSTNLKLVEVSFAMQGRHRNLVTRELPIAAFEIRDGVAYPVTVVPRVPDAHYYLADGKVWWSEDGAEYASWAALTGPVYLQDAKDHPPAAQHEPAITTPSVGPPDDAVWGIGQQPQGPRPWR